MAPVDMVIDCFLDEEAALLKSMSHDGSSNRRVGVAGDAAADDDENEAYDDDEEHKEDNGTSRKEVVVAAAVVDTSDTAVIINPWSIDSQGRFAKLIASVSSSTSINCDVLMIDEASKNNKNDQSAQQQPPIEWQTRTYHPSKRYIQKLLSRYTTRLESESHGILLEDDNLASLVCYFSMMRKSTVPDPCGACLVGFDVPLAVALSNGASISRDMARAEEATTNDTTNNNTTNNTNLLQIQTYPHHNDVGVMKVWEAGACLAEYILQYPHVVIGKSVVELGAGVGLTGLVAACCSCAGIMTTSGDTGQKMDGRSTVGATRVHMTDYTEATLDNLGYNIELNKEWLRSRGVNEGVVTSVSMLNRMRIQLVNHHRCETSYCFFVSLIFV